MYFLNIMNCCQSVNTRFDVPFRRINPVFFLSKNGDDATCEGEDGGKSVHFLLESAPPP